jgi:hypothetical protein
MARLVAAGVRLAPEGTGLRFWSATPLPPELRELIVAHKPAILAALSVWCSQRALALQTEADGLVADAGVSGHDPEISAAAERCVDAHRAKDMPGVRLACLTIAKRVHSLTVSRIASDAEERKPSRTA